MSYNGVYSEAGIGTSIGTEVTINKGLVTGKGSESLRQYVSNASLEDANLNVAKIRLVSTIPGKLLDKDVRDKAYVGFILTGVQESHNEKMELVPLPGDSFASYFYGANPRQFSFSGILLNTEQDQWRDSFEQLYEEHLRGSVSARNFSIVQVSYNGRIVSGWLTSLSQQLDSKNDLYAMFNFNILVSRIDMIGGSGKYKDYLVKLSDSNNDFANSKIDADYAILDPTNFNGLIDPIRTGLVIPPKRPHKARGKRKNRSPDCWFPVDKTTASKVVVNGGLTANDHINDATVCTVINTIEGTALKIKDLQRQAEEKLKNTTGENGELIPPTTAAIQESEDLQTQARALAAELEKRRLDPDIILAIDAETDAAVDRYRQASQELKDGKPTARALRAKAALESGNIRVGKAATIINASGDGSTGIPFLELGSKDDPDLYDGQSTSGQFKQSEKRFYSTGEDKTKGLVPEAKRRRKEYDEKQKEKRREERAKQAANANTPFLDG